MKALIVFASQHGCAEKCAAKLGEQLTGNVTTQNLKRAKNVDLAGFDTVVIGGSIHAGKIQKVVKQFCENNLDILKTKRLGLFLCCMEEGKKAEEQFAAAFPEELIRSAAARGLFGGELDLDKMNWMERAITKKVAKIDASVSKIKEQNVQEFARTLNESAA